MCQTQDRLAQVRNGMLVKDLGQVSIWAKQYLRVYNLFYCGWKWGRRGREPDLLHIIRNRELRLLIIVMSIFMCNILQITEPFIGMISFDLIIL